MRASLVLLPLSLCAAPALAQPASTQAPPQLVDPATADQVANAVQTLSKALLDLKIGTVQAALEGREPTASERNLTVRDLGRRRDTDFERHLDQQIAAARPMIQQGIRAMNETLPQVTEDLQRAQKSIERAIANMPDPNYPKR